MTMNGTASGSEIVEGRVVGENAKGIRLDGTEMWLNYSRFAAVPHPVRGQTVRVEVGSDGFIRRLAVLDSAEVPAPASNSAPAAAPDHMTVRMAVLESASRFAASRGEEIKSGDVLRIADRWLSWVVEQPARHTIDDLEGE
jgi:hypothetical protein